MFYLLFEQIVLRYRKRHHERGITLKQEYYKVLRALAKSSFEDCYHGLNIALESDPQFKKYMERNYRVQVYERENDFYLTANERNFHLIGFMDAIICLERMGLILWNRLPDEIATHFGSGNVANGWSSKPFAVFGIPGIMVAVELLLYFVTTNDPKKRNIDDKIMRFCLWIIPVTSLIVCLSCYGIALGIPVDIGFLVNILIGIMFIFLGNYLHRIKQNYTVGIKLPWTLNSEENWNRTHRMASWLYVICGLLFIVNAFFQFEAMYFAVLLFAFIPGVYSYILYKKGI